MATRNLAAVDLGASSGRILLARFDGRQLSLQEVHRFSNQSVQVCGHRFWNILAMWDEILSGLRKAHQEAGELDSIGVDTWGVDYGLVDVQGFLQGIPLKGRAAMRVSLFITCFNDTLFPGVGIATVCLLEETIAKRGLVGLAPVWQWSPM